GDWGGAADQNPLTDDGVLLQAKRLAAAFVQVQELDPADAYQVIAQFHFGFRSNGQDGGGRPGGDGEKAIGEGGPGPAVRGQPRTGRGAAAGDGLEDTAIAELPGRAAAAEGESLGRTAQLAALDEQRAAGEVKPGVCPVGGLALELEARPIAPCRP